MSTDVVDNVEPTIDVEDETLPGDGDEQLDDARRPVPGWLLPALEVVVALGVVVGFFVTFALVLSGIQEHRNQTQLYGTLRGLLSPQSAVSPYIGGKIPIGSPVALVESKAAGFHNLVIVEGTTSDQMRDGPGHLANSPLPGQVGDSIVIGRGTTTGAPFGSISTLTRGDAITVTTGQGTFHYVVEDLRHSGSHLPRIPASGSILTLVTSAGTGPLGGITNGNLLYVDAAMRGTAAATPKRAPRTITAAAVQGHGDSAAAPWVLLWLGILAATTAGLRWLLVRWGWRRAWIIAAPVAIAVLWGFSDELLQLAPNVF